MSRIELLKAVTRFQQEAQLPQRNSASAAHVYLGWLTDRATHRTPQNRMDVVQLGYRQIVSAKKLSDIRVR